MPPMITAVFKKEIETYFLTPLAYVFMIVFLVLSGVLTFFVGHFFERNQSDLFSFFEFFPWLCVFFVPAIAMRLWAEERHVGTFELLMAWPLPVYGIVVGKFLAAWCVLLLTLLFTFPLWWTVNFLGSPDNGMIAVGYASSALLAAADVSLAFIASAVTKNQVVAFVLGVFLCFVVTGAGFPAVFMSPWVGEPLLSFVATFSLLDHFEELMRGMVALQDVLFFVLTTLFGLAMTSLLVARHRGP